MTIATEVVRLIKISNTELIAKIRLIHRCSRHFIVNQD
jgi:hypothetical protein